jgi:hypothetical protein
MNEASNQDIGSSREEREHSLGNTELSEGQRELNSEDAIQELARRTYDETRMYVPVAPGMLNQIHRMGLLPKKTLDGDHRYINNIVGSKTYYKEYVYYDHSS